MAAPSPTDRAALTNNILKVRWDAKSPQGRRCRDLFRSVMRMIGNPAEPARQAQAVSAVELIVMAEAARETALKDPSSRLTLEAVYKAEKAMRHALAALGIDKPPSADETQGPYGLYIDDDDGDAT